MLLAVRFGVAAERTVQVGPDAFNDIVSFQLVAQVRVDRFDAADGAALRRLPRQAGECACVQQADGRVIGYQEDRDFLRSPRERLDSIDVGIEHGDHTMRQRMPGG